MATVLLALLFVLIRMYVKIGITHVVGWEDYFCIVALATAIARTALDFVTVRVHHLGRHSVMLTMDDLQGVTLGVTIDGLLYILAISLVKLSILVFLLRLFGVNRESRYTSWVLAFIITVWAMVTLLLCIFSCRPIVPAFSFKALTDPKTVCSPHNYDVENIFGFCNIIADFALLIMPIPMLWSLHMPTPKKLGVAIVFASGTLICAIAILRQFMLYHPPYGSDFSRQMVIVKIWMTVEVNIAIVLACLPVIQPLFRKMPFLLPFLSSSWASWLSSPSAAQKRSWPKKFSGHTDEERGNTPQPMRQDRFWKEPDESSQTSAQALYHEEKKSQSSEEGSCDGPLPRVELVSVRFAEEGYGQAR